MRKGMAQGLARPTYYDRNAIPQARSYSQGAIAPHAQTQRWTYTVPAGKKAFIEEIFGQVRRETAAAPVGRIDIQVIYVPVTGSSMFIALPIIYTNVVGDQQTEFPPQLGLMVAGDLIHGDTEDTSTGGTAAFVAAIKFVEFDI